MFSCFGCCDFEEENNYPALLPRGGSAYRATTVDRRTRGIAHPVIYQVVPQPPGNFPNNLRPSFVSLPPTVMVPKGALQPPTGTIPQNPRPNVGLNSPQAEGSTRPLLREENLEKEYFEGLISSKNKYKISCRVYESLFRKSPHGNS